MKTTQIITGILVGTFAVSVIACSSDVKRTPGRVYMPDMAYSRAYETYASTENLTQEGIHYDHLPVSGTISRGEELPFHLAKDAPGDSINYVASKQVKNPLPALDSAQLDEARRLFNINCAICHGDKLDGNGPLYKGGDGPFAAKPANLSGSDPKYVAMPEGQMFYSIEYGKNLMGSYASQLNRKQRWAIIHYIKSKQGAAAAPAAKTDSTATAKK